MTPQLQADRSPVATAAPSRRRWLLFVHQLPSQPSNLRVTTWRRLQQIGAIPLKQAVYALPDTPDAREDFEWLKTEVKAAGGEASVFAADNVDAWADDVLVEEFRRARQDLYEELIWKDRCQGPGCLLFDSTTSPHPAYQAIRVRALLESSQLIGRAATTMNHSDIRGLGTA